MQIVALEPSRGRLKSIVAGVAALIVLTAVLPVLALPVALFLPLLICPLVGTKMWWGVIPGIIAPALTAFAAGQPVLYAASLLFCSGLPVAATMLLNRWKMAELSAYAYYIGAYAMAVSLVLASLQGLFPGRLAEGVAQLITQSVAASPDSLITLYRLAAARFISAPKGFDGQNPLSLMLDPGLIRQLTLSLHLTLSETLTQLFPSLAVHTCLLGGVFTTLNVRRLNHRYLLVDSLHKESVKVAFTPSFTALKMPKKCGGALTAMGLAGILFSMTESAWCQQLSALLYVSFVAGYALVGAAALMRAFEKRWPKSKALAGLLAAILYALFTTVLFLFGVLDALTHPSGEEGSKKTKEDEDQ